MSMRGLGVCNVEQESFFCVGSGPVWGRLGCYMGDGLFGTVVATCICPLVHWQAWPLHVTDDDTITRSRSYFILTCFVTRCKWHHIRTRKSTMTSSSSSRRFFGEEWTLLSTRMLGGGRCRCAYASLDGNRHFFEDANRKLNNWHTPPPLSQHSKIFVRRHRH